jgi:hypothetical protein
MKGTPMPSSSSEDEKNEEPDRCAIFLGCQYYQNEVKWLMVAQQNKMNIQIQTYQSVTSIRKMYTNWASSEPTDFAPDLTSDAVMLKYTMTDNTLLTWLNIISRHNFCPEIYPCRFP